MNTGRAQSQLHATLVAKYITDLNSRWCSKTILSIKQTKSQKKKSIKQTKYTEDIINLNLQFFEKNTHKKSQLTQEDKRPNSFQAMEFEGT